MSLSSKQQRFTVAVSHLLNYARAKGYGLTFGDAYRDARLHGEFGDKQGYAHRNSVHKLRLAVDLNLFVGGEYISDGTHVAYQDLGAFWKTLDAEARWGGDFRDANHFSFTHWGAK